MPLVGSIDVTTATLIAACSTIWLSNVTPKELKATAVVMPEQFQTGDEESSPQQHQPQRADEAQFFTDHREDEVGVGFGQEAQLLPAFAQTYSHQTTGTQ